jgi:hypothetical protein
VNELFWKLRDALVAYCKQHGEARGLHVFWDTVQAIVQTVTSSEVRISEAPDRIVCLSDYVMDHGDPQLNNKGHKLLMHEGFECVLIPGKKEWARQKAKIETVQKVCTVADSSAQPWGSIVDDAFADLGSSLFASLPMATGVPMSHVLMFGNSYLKTASGSIASGSGECAPASSNGASSSKAKGEEDDDDDLMRPSTGWSSATAPTKRPAHSPAPSGEHATGSNADPKKRRVTGVSIGDAVGVGGAGVASGIKGRGRPKIDRQHHVAEMLREFANSGQDEKYFSQLSSFKRQLCGLKGVGLFGRIP